MGTLENASLQTLMARFVLQEIQYGMVLPLREDREKDSTVLPPAPRSCIQTVLSSRLGDGNRFPLRTSLAGVGYCPL